ERKVELGRRGTRRRVAGRGRRVDRNGDLAHIVLEPPDPLLHDADPGTMRAQLVETNGPGDGPHLLRCDVAPEAPAVAVVRLAGARWPGPRSRDRLDSWYSRRPDARRRWAAPGRRNSHPRAGRSPAPATARRSGARAR